MGGQPRAHSVPPDSASQTLHRRFWIYQAERFPLVRTATLVAVFSAASVAVSARLAERPLPGFAAFLVAFVVVLALFFQMRVCDEFKDHEDDCRYRPERPVPRGLVSLRELASAGVLAGCVALAATLVYDLGTSILLLIVWTWLGLMTLEFFAPEALRQRPLLYLVSHMAIMPLIDLFTTGCEWAVHGAAPPHTLLLFLALSFVNGCVLEIGRKTWAPESEREGVETYSALWGPRTSALVWLAVAGLSLLLLIAVGFAERAPGLIAAVGALAFVPLVIVALAFRRAPTPVLQKRIEDMAGLWVFACYASAGFLPLIADKL